MFAEDDVVKSHKPRAELIGNFILILFAIILARLWYLQIFEGKTLYRYSIENRLRKEIVPAPRGMVFSRNNHLLIHNIPRFDAIVTPQYLRNKKETIEKLAQILSMESDKIYALLKKNVTQASYRPIVVKKNLSRQEVAIIETENFKMPGISVQSVISREYTQEDIGAHLLGYISEISSTQLPKYRERDEFNYKLGDFIGHFGVEEEFDSEIRGEDGIRYVEVDAQGRMKRQLSSTSMFRDIENKPEVPGRNIRLTIDKDLQEAAYKALEGKTGSAVAVDVNTGEILAMVSRPSYNPSLFSKGITNDLWEEITSDERNPLRDRTVQEHYPPGSTFKTFTAIAALEEGIVDENTEVHCPGYFYLGKRKVHCWREHGHGKVDIYKAIRESCDVYFYKIATKMDIDVLAKYARMFGYGRKTGITLPRETTGLIPTKEWKMKRNGQEWHLGETLSCVIGQSYILATPLQLAMSYAGIANGGKLFKPNIIKEVFSNSGEIHSNESAAVFEKINVSPKTLKLVQEGLSQVVNNPKGTAWWYRGKGNNMAGKTGTVQVVRSSADKIYQKCEEKEYKLRHHGLFAAYAPVDNPKIAIGVVVEHGCHGSSAASPVAREIVSAYLDKYYPEDKQRYLAEDKLLYAGIAKKSSIVAPVETTPEVPKEVEEEGE
jgi:penicillin-binding protein 2